MNTLLSLVSIMASLATFQGQGSAFFPKSGNSRICTTIALKMDWSEQSFRLMEGGYACEDLSASFDPFVLEFRGDKVFSEGKEVGTHGSDFLEIRYEDQNEGFTYHWLLKKQSNGSIRYLEEWHEGPNLALSITGDLKPI